MYAKMLNADSYIATTLVYGQNHFSDNHKTLPSVLLEGTAQLHKTAVYSRYEFVRKDADELSLDDIYPLNPNFNINAFTLGLNRILFAFKSTDVRGGLQSTLNFSPGQLQSIYGSVPVGFEVYLRISPSITKAP